MKKNQIKGHFKDMKGKVKEVANKVVRSREPGYEGNRQNAHYTIEAAYADMKTAFKTAG